MCPRAALAALADSGSLGSRGFKGSLGKGSLLRSEKLKISLTRLVGEHRRIQHLQAANLCVFGWCDGQVKATRTGGFHGVEFPERSSKGLHDAI